MDTQRVVFTVTEDMHAALKRQAASRGATLSGIMRVILGEWLKEQGEPVDWQIEWGGRRDDNE